MMLEIWTKGKRVLGIIQIFLQLAKSCNGEKYWQPNRSDNLSTPLFWETRLGTEFLRDIGNSSNLAPCPSYQLEEALLLVIYHYNFSFLLSQCVCKSMIPSAHLSLKCLNSTAVRLRLKKTTRVSLKKVCSRMNKQLPFRCTLSLKTNRLTKKSPTSDTALFLSDSETR